MYSVKSISQEAKLTVKLNTQLRL